MLLPRIRLPLSAPLISFRRDLLSVARLNRETDSILRRQIQRNGTLNLWGGLRENQGENSNESSENQASQQPRPDNQSNS
mmetsp:Transcript_17190/g.19884  ORF Transcript_17190/g.19884 Transcript_17190/m.19884 type:complete len:80 (+) Transcript_17190:1558-1797(+)